MKVITSLVCSFTIIFLTGCSYIRNAVAPDDKNLLSGSGSIMKSKKTGESDTSTEGFEELDLQELLQKYGLDNPSNIATQQGASPEEYKYRRNDLQERLISASNQRCGAYLRTIVSSKATTQTAWTSLASLFSGAAAVLPDVQTAKALAASSTVSTSVLSTYNEAYFNNLAINTISAGISKKREGILASISNSQKKTLTEYSVNAAVSDAINYHAACNIVSGMEAASQATTNADKETFSLAR